MLDLSQVVADISALASVAHERRIKNHAQIKTAVALARVTDQDWEVAQSRVAQQTAPWPMAVRTQASPGTASGIAGDIPAKYTILATDGSQIPLDRHAIAPCFLINIGLIALHYGTGERCHLSSSAKLHYRDEEIYQRDVNNDPVPLTEKIVATRRLLAESAALTTLIAHHHDRCAIALVDDPLIVWTPNGESEADQRRVVDDFCQMLRAGQQANMPIAGYISRPSSKDVVGLLRLLLCDSDCAHCTKSPCAALSGLSDAALFATLLPNCGDRSIVFQSAARALKYYPDDQQVFFFYLNAGHEIARIEIPRWVAEDKTLLQRVHQLCSDQARKGFGYPVALSEAHEQAVVRGPEREAFQRLLENAFAREHIPAFATRKALAKRTRLL